MGESKMRMVSGKTEEIEYSKIRKMFNAALACKDPISFTVGEPDFTAAVHIVRAGCDAAQEGHTKYSANAGILPLREAISAYLKQQIGLEYDPEREVTVTTGAMSALYQGLKVILDPGDEVIVNEPCWTNYIQQIKMSYGIPVSVACSPERGFEPDPEEIRRAVTPKTKAIIINSPCNPTGAVLSKEVLEQIAAIAVERDLLVISDEVYKHILFDDAAFVSIATFPGMKERTLVVDSFSKTFAMTGFRVGYAAGPEEWVKNITKLQENISACVAMPSQYAAIAALEGGFEFVEKMVSEYKMRRDYIYERMQRMPLIRYQKAGSTFYAFCDIRGTGMSADRFAMDLLKEMNVVVVPGDAFGEYGEGFIRISFATSLEQIQKGMDLLERFLRKIETGTK